MRILKDKTFGPGAIITVKGEQDLWKINVIFADRTTGNPIVQASSIQRYPCCNIFDLKDCRLKTPARRRTK